MIFSNRFWETVKPVLLDKVKFSEKSQQGMSTE